jgi:hypothetical protein
VCLFESYNSVEINLQLQGLSLVTLRNLFPSNVFYLFFCVISQIFFICLYEYSHYAVVIFTYYVVENLPCQNTGVAQV